MKIRSEFGTTTVWFSFGSNSQDIVSNVRVIYIIVDGVYSLNLI